jgi:hypothetical protein
MKIKMNKSRKKQTRKKQTRKKQTRKRQYISKKYKKGGFPSCNDPNYSIFNTNFLSLFPYKP